MKKLFTLIFILGLISNTFSQTKHFDIGLEGGAGLVFLRGNDFIKLHYKPTVGISIGISFQYSFSNNFALRSGLAYERKGGRFMVLAEQSGVTEEIKGHSNYDYLTLPVLIRASIGKKIKYFANTGFYIGGLVRQTLEYNSDGVVFKVPRFDNTINDKLFDFGLVLGAGVYIPIKEQFFLSAEIRDDLGLTNTSKVPIMNNGKIKNNSTKLLICFGYRFGNTSQ